jgi:hypothetical protein
MLFSTALQLSYSSARCGTLALCWRSSSGSPLPRRGTKYYWGYPGRLPREARDVLVVFLVILLAQRSQAQFAQFPHLLF